MDVIYLICNFTPHIQICYFGCLSGALSFILASRVIGDWFISPFAFSQFLSPFSIFTVPMHPHSHLTCPLPSSSQKNLALFSWRKRVWATCSRQPAVGLSPLLPVQRRCCPPHTESHAQDSKRGAAPEWSPDPLLSWSVTFRHVLSSHLHYHHTGEKMAALSSQTWCRWSTVMHTQCLHVSMEHIEQREVRTVAGT